MSADVTDATDAAPVPRRGERPTRPFSRFKLALWAIAFLLIGTSPLWAPLLMRRMAFFHVKRVEIIGARYVPPAEILARLHVDTNVSVWDPLGKLARRVETHPEVKSAKVERKLPGTLIVEVVERTPVALVPSANGFRVFDERGVLLPIDPTHAPVDAPVLDRADPTVLKLLGGLRQRLPSLYDRISAVRAVGSDELRFDLKTVPVRAMKNASLDRFADIDPVENDLAKRHLRVSEIDLRYRDQVIARLP